MQDSQLAVDRLALVRERPRESAVVVPPEKKATPKRRAKKPPPPRHWWNPFGRKPPLPQKIPFRQPVLPPGQLSFICDICGNAAEAGLELVAGREMITCACGSTLRFRALIAALQERLFGEVQPLARLAQHKEIKGVGMSETGVYCHLLEKKFDYINTFLDAKPILDLLDPAPEYLGRSHFVICSDVMEHVRQPLDLAFQNLRRLLRPCGTLVFTVPYSLGEGITEHFPDLYSYQIENDGENTCLVNTDRNGERSIYRDVHFHGGNGLTLEMRLFSLGGVMEILQQSGFREIKVHRDQRPEWGIVNLSLASHPITAVAQ